jgi:hypothetical protein
MIASSSSSVFLYSRKRVLRRRAMMRVVVRFSRSRSLSLSHSFENNLKSRLNWIQSSKEEERNGQKEQKERASTSDEYLSLFLSFSRIFLVSRNVYVSVIF